MYIYIYIYINIYYTIIWYTTNVKAEDMREASACQVTVCRRCSCTTSKEPQTPKP